MAFTVVLCLAGSASPASGHYFFSSGSPGTWIGDPPANGVWFTNNANWAVAERNLTANIETAAGATLTGEFDTTDLILLMNWDAASCTPSQGFDLCLFDQDYGDIGAYAWNSCAGQVVGSHPTQVCTQSWVRFNLWNAGNFSLGVLRSLTCHEIAHSVGIQHNPDAESCANDDAIWQKFLSDHDRVHINNRY